MSTTAMQRATRRLEDLARAAPPHTRDVRMHPPHTANSVLEHTPLVDNLLAVLADALADAVLAAPSSSTAPSRFDELMRMLEEPEMQAALRQHDPLALARIGGMRIRQQLLQAEGGVCSAAEMAARLGMTPQGVDECRRKGTLLAVNLGKHGYRYPVWQIGVEGLDVALLAMHDYGPWTQWAYMLSIEGLLDDATPLAVLRRGEVERVLDAIDMIGEQIAR